MYTKSDDERRTCPESRIIWRYLFLDVQFMQMDFRKFNRPFVLQRTRRRPGPPLARSCFDPNKSLFITERKCTWDGQCMLSALASRLLRKGIFEAPWLPSFVDTADNAGHKHGLVDFFSARCTSRRRPVLFIYAYWCGYSSEYR